MRKTLRNRATMLWCAAIVLLAAMPALLLPAGAGWITDNGNKYIIMRSLAEGGTTAIANPAAGIVRGKSAATSNSAAAIAPSAGRTSTPRSPKSRYHGSVSAGKYSG